MARIEFHQLTKRYGPLTAVDRLSFSPAPGRITGFVGANGAGKSTTIRMLLGLTRPSFGTATIDGRPYAELPDPLRSVGALVDPNIFHPRRTGTRCGSSPGPPTSPNGASITSWPWSGSPTPRGAAPAATRPACGSASPSPRRCSATPTLVLDEPANGLDPEGVHWLRGLIKSLAAEGRTVFVSSHLLAELAQTIDDVAIIARGRLITHQPMADLLAHAGDASLEDVYLQLTRAAQPPTDSPLKEMS